MITPTPVGGYGYVCTIAGKSSATAPSFPTTIGATVADGTAVWTCLGPATPLWTFKVADIASVTRVVTNGGITQIFTSGGGNSPVGTVTVAANRLTWTAPEAADINVDFDIVELQSTICMVDPTHPNHLVFTTGIGAPWRAAMAYATGVPVQPTAPGTGCYYACTTAGTSAAAQPAFPTVAGQTVADGTVVWTCVGPAVVFRTLTFDQSFDPNTGSWTRSLAIVDREFPRARPRPTRRRAVRRRDLLLWLVSLSRGGMAADALLCGRRANTANACQRMRVRMHDPGNERCHRPGFSDCCRSNNRGRNRSLDLSRIRTDHRVCNRDRRARLC